MDFIRKIVKEVLFESDGIVTNLHFKDIDDWGAWLYEENDIRYWRIFNNKHQQIGDLSKNGKLRFDLNHKGFWKTVDKKFEFSENGVKQATRYAWLMNQKPMENKEQIIREIISKSNYSPFNYKRGKELKFKNLPDMYAVIDMYYGQQAWIIYLENIPIGILEWTGALHIQNQYSSDDFIYNQHNDVRWEDIENDYWETLNKSFGSNLEQAMRYVFLKNQKMINEAGVLGYGRQRKKTIYPDIGNFFTTELYLPDGTFFRYDIFTPNNKRVGQLSYVGVLIYASDGDEWEKANNNFKNKLKQAVRYVFLKTRKPIKNKEKLKDLALSGRNIAMSGQVFKRLKFEDIDGWGAVLLEEDGYIYWTISNKEGHNVGELYKNNELRYDDSDEFEWTVADVEFAFDESGAKKATRYIFLKTQKPIIAEQIPNITEATYGAKISILGLKGWSVRESKTEAGVPWWDFFDEYGAWSGYLVKEGDTYNLSIIYETGNFEKIENRDFGTNYIQAARYIFLKRQKPI